MTESNEELLPCPFCGGEPRMTENTYAAMAWVACPTCGLEAPSETGVDRLAALNYWNRRVPALALRTPSEIPSDAELMALNDECLAMPGGRGLLYRNYAHEILRRYTRHQGTEVKVGELEWEAGEDEDDPAWEVADTVIGRYSIQRGILVFVGVSNEELTQITVAVAGDLKAAAQAHFNECILSALTPGKE